MTDCVTEHRHSECVLISIWIQVLWLIWKWSREWARVFVVWARTHWAQQMHEKCVSDSQSVQCTRTSHIAQNRANALLAIVTKAWNKSPDWNNVRYLWDVNNLFVISFDEKKERHQQTNKQLRTERNKRRERTEQEVNEKKTWLSKHRIKIIAKHNDGTRLIGITLASRTLANCNCAFAYEFTPWTMDWMNRISIQKSSAGHWTERKNKRTHTLTRFDC